MSLERVLEDADPTPSHRLRVCETHQPAFYANNAAQTMSDGFVRPFQFTASTHFSKILKKRKEQSEDLSVHST